MSDDAFRFRPMTQGDAEAIALWRYPEPFSFSDWSADAHDLAELLSPQLRGEAYFSVDGEDGELAGFFAFKQRQPDTVEVGLGLHPERTGHGLGTTFVDAGLRYARSRFRPARFVLAVATFNRRAITVYERAGFARGRVYMHATNGGYWEFVEMTRPAES
jgi:[ribosomal protein S18]-alanine N-acetyltransferase